MALFTLADVLNGTKRLFTKSVVQGKKTDLTYEDIKTDDAGALKTSTTLTGSNVVNGGQVKTTLYSSTGNEPSIGSLPNVDGWWAGNLTIATSGFLGAFNGDTWDRQRNNTEGTLLASAARTVATSSPIQTNHNSKGIMLYLNITAISGTGIYPLVRGIDPISSVEINLNADIAPLTAIGSYVIELYPSVSGSGGANVKQKTSGILPRKFGVTIWHTDGSSVTYSVGYSLIL